MNRLMRGSFGGLAGTVAMSLVLVAGKATGLMQVAPPKQITKNAERSADVNPQRMPQPVFDATWVASHFGYGTAVGALYAIIRPILPSSSLGSGVLYGLVVWAVSYFKLLPSLGLFPPPEHDSASRQAVLAAAHVVYGGTLGEVVDRL